MDINLAQTFLEVVRCGSFIAAAERLHVTQTTVTTRIQNLEEQLGCKLFIRNRSGARLTENGSCFISHASQLLQTWESARRDLPLPDGAANLITIGGELSLWNPLLLKWVLLLGQKLPDVAVRAEVGATQTLHQKLEAGSLDAALVHQPDYWPGMQVEQLLEEKLVLVRSKQNPEPYVYIDWGEYFRQQHDTALAEYSRAKISLNLGPLALYYLLENGGSGYFRTRVVEPHIQSGALEVVPQAPEFSYPVYLIYSRNRYSNILEQALAMVREAAKADIDWSQR